MHGMLLSTNKRTMSKRTINKTARNNLQPWLEYFEMLQEYEANLILEVATDKHEAYVTLSAFHAMTPGTDPAQQTGLPETARRIRAYAGWKSMQGPEYLKRPFALHIVKEDLSHDLIYTLLLSRHRCWWWPWKISEEIYVIDYPTKKR